MSEPLAVLIDAENMPSSLFAPLRRAVDRLGTPIAWQLHGDFFSWPHPGWQAIAERESIEIRHQPQGGKNCADIAMTIAAMDLMRDGIVRGICIVSSDSDFAPLARRLKAGNLVVHGFGESKTRDGFRRACATFHVLTPDVQAPAPKPVAVPTPTSLAATIAAPSLEAADVRRLREILTAACGAVGRVDGATAAAALRQRAPHLAERLVIKGRFFKHLAATGVVEILEDGSQHVISVRPPRLEVVAR